MEEKTDGNKRRKSKLSDRIGHDSRVGGHLIGQAKSDYHSNMVFLKGLERIERQLCRLESDFEPGPAGDKKLAHDKNKEDRKQRVRGNKRF